MAIIADVISAILIEAMPGPPGEARHASARLPNRVREAVS